MKIGIQLNDYGKGYARFGQDRFQAAARHGFAAVDYEMASTDIPLYSFSDSQLREKMIEERQAAERAQVAISQVHGPWRWPPQDSTVEERRERLEKMKKSILATRYLGCSYWVVHPIMPYGIDDLCSGHAEDTWKLNVEFMTELLAYARKQDVTICLENMPMRNFSLATPSQVLKFVQAMNDDHFQICLDTGHVAIFPDLSLSHAVRELGKAIRVIHVHDNMGDGDQHLWPTRGKIDWPGFAAALKDVGYDGVFSIETCPSETLDTPSYEAECVQLHDIAQRILDQVGL